MLAFFGSLRQDKGQKYMPRHLKREKPTDEHASKSCVMAGACMVSAMGKSTYEVTHLRALTWRVMQGLLH